MATAVRSAGLVAQRRKQIAEAAYVIFREKGFKSATVEEVASLLRIDKATLYGYIVQKEDLLFLLFQHFIPRLTARLDAVAAQHPEPKARLEALIAEQLCVVQEQPDLVLLTYRELRHLHAEALQEVFTMIRANQAPFREAIRDGINSGVLHEMDPDIATHALLSMLYMWAAQSWDLNRLGMSAVAAEVTRLFFNGALRRPTKRSGRPP